MRTKHNMRVFRVIPIVFYFYSFTPKTNMLHFVLMNSVILNLLCVWIMLAVIVSDFCFESSIFFIQFKGRHGWHTWTTNKTFTCIKDSQFKSTTTQAALIPEVLLNRMHYLEIHQRINSITHLNWYKAQL